MRLTPLWTASSLVGLTVLIGLTVACGQAATATPTPTPTLTTAATATPTPVVDRRINVNTASATKLEELPGIGPVRANAIVAYRNEHGPFRTVDELILVQGIGPSILDQLRPLVKVADQ
jgi:competence protein ComEA